MDSVQTEQHERQRGGCLVCEMLAYDEAVLRERVASLEEDNAWSRGLVVQTVGALADLTKERDRYRRDYYALREAFADFRARVLLEAGIAA